MFTVIPVQVQATTEHTPYSRQVHDIIHKITAVGSRTVSKAQEFIDGLGGDTGSIKAYGSYEEVYRDDVSENISKHSAQSPLSAPGLKLIWKF